MAAGRRGDGLQRALVHQRVDDGRRAGCGVGKRFLREDEAALRSREHARTGGRRTSRRNLCLAINHAPGFGLSAFGRTCREP